MYNFLNNINKFNLEKSDICVSSKLTKSPLKLLEFTNEDFEVVSASEKTQYILDRMVNIQVTNDKIVIIPQDDLLSSIIVTPSFILLDLDKIVIVTNNAEYTLSRLIRQPA